MDISHKLLVIVAALITIISANETLIMPPAIKKLDSVTNCLLRIAKNDVRSHLTVLIRENKETKYEEDRKFFDEITEKLIAHHIPRTVTEYFRNLTETRLFKGNILCFMYFKDCEQLSKFQEEIIDENVFNLVIINKYSNESCSPLLSKLGRATCEHHVSFLTMIPGETEHKIFTFLPKIDSNTCKIKTDLEPVEVSNCHDKNTGNDKIFPEKTTRNLYKCPLNVGMASFRPFTFIPNHDKLKNLDPLIKISGSDYEIVKIIADYLNATVRPYFIKVVPENPWGYREFIHFLNNGTLDVCAGGLYRLYGTEVEYTGPPSSQELLWAYTVERTNRSWKELIDKFDGLYIFILFYLYYSFIWFLFSKFDKQETSLISSLLYSWGTLLGTASLQYINISTKQKIAYGVFLIMCIHWASYTNIQLYSFLTINDPPAIMKHNKDVMSSDRPLFLNLPARGIVSDVNFKTYANKSKDCAVFEDCVEKTWKFKGVTMLLDAQYITFQIMTAVHGEAKVMRSLDPIIILYHEMILGKDTLVLEKFRTAITRLTESGINNRLYMQQLGILNVAKAQVYTKSMLSKSYGCQLGCSITMNQIAGGLYIWLLGSGLSCLVFVIEILYRYNEKKPNQ